DAYAAPEGNRPRIARRDCVDPLRDALTDGNTRRHDTHDGRAHGTPNGPRSVAQGLAPGNAAVDGRLAGEAQHAVADDVALDLVGAAGARHPGAPTHRALDRVRTATPRVAPHHRRHVVVAVEQHRLRAEQRGHELREPPPDHRRRELAE